MRPKFITALYFGGRILLFEEHGDVYEYSPLRLTWTLLSRSPWPDAGDLESPRATIAGGQL